jgi:hypothetical protein
MAEEFTLKSLSDLIKQVQDDVTAIKSDSAQLRASKARLTSGIADVRVDVARLAMKLDSLRELFEERFDRLHSAAVISGEIKEDSLFREISTLTQPSSLKRS